MLCQLRSHFQFCRLCSFRKYPIPPRRRALLFYTPHHPGISVPGGACHIPPTPGISVIFELGLVPAGKNISLKNAVAPYFYAKDDCFCDKA